MRSRQAISGKNALIHIRIRVFNRRGHRVRGEREKVAVGCVRLEMLDRHGKYNNVYPMINLVILLEKGENSLNHLGIKIFREAVSFLSVIEKESLGIISKTGFHLANLF